MDVISLDAERDRRNGPDEQFVTVDPAGRRMFAFCLDYQMGGLFWTATIWAYDFEDAELRADAMRENLKVAGQIYAEVPG
ncbi:hypothetical protein HFO65_15845 [Rhizobium laguerreae]|uniref:hypothetical protein n=1 Tax=Rhizobium laguerreae TaxID=1076926 RepID=UPI001C90301D|nr:hypothetical protein [Rhizobium laguerreae]MBY3162107.1 hypothetical protein [Rhizobium laguerreae]